jgi:hypothetical protein
MGSLGKRTGTPEEYSHPSRKGRVEKLGGLARKRAGLQPGADFSPIRRSTRICEKPGIEELPGMAGMGQGTGAAEGYPVCAVHEI